MRLVVTLAFLIFCLTAIFYKESLVKLFSDEAEVKILQDQYQKHDIGLFFIQNIFFDYKGFPVSNIAFNKFDQSQDIIIHFWASWCAPCINEIPELLNFKNKFQNNNNILFITISLDDENEQIEKFLKSFKEFNNEDFIKIWDKSKLTMKKFNIDRLPMTVFIKGSEVRVVRGVVDWKALIL